MTLPRAAGGVDRFRQQDPESGGVFLACGVAVSPAPTFAGGSAGLRDFPVDPGKSIDATGASVWYSAVPQSVSPICYERPVSRKANARTVPVVVIPENAGIQRRLSRDPGFRVPLRGPGMTTYGRERQLSGFPHCGHSLLSRRLRRIAVMAEDLSSPKAAYRLPGSDPAAGSPWWAFTASTYSASTVRMCW